jgi:AAA15 family ATPase/GTPase
VVIEDLTPITMFIGANASGKSNILDGLYFLRHALTNNRLYRK